MYMLLNYPQITLMQLPGPLSSLAHHRRHPLTWSGDDGFFIFCF